MRALPVLRSIALPIAALGALHLPAARADYPDHPIRYIVPSAAGNGADISARMLTAGIAKVCASPAYQAKVAATGSVCATGSVEDFVAFTKRERVKWGDIVRRSNAKID